MDGTAEEAGNRDPEDSLAAVFRRAIARARQVVTGEEPSTPAISERTTLAELEDAIRDAGLSLEVAVAEGALAAARGPSGLEERAERDALEFVTASRRPEDELVFTSTEASVRWILDPELLHRAVRETNLITELLYDLSLANGVPIFELLGLRNLSAFVGEIFKTEIYKLDKDRFRPNPHQDGYPDLMALTPEGREYIQRHEARMSDKTLWSPYPFGGVEIKATVGSTPPARKVAKPEIGEPRWGLLTGADWKAHHRETNNLIGTYWDFISKLPTVLAVFFRNDLSVVDWGKIVKPKDAGGRTTSVSIMSRDGVKRMGEGWMVLPARADLRAAICQRRVFDVSDERVRMRAPGEYEFS